jgi:hypothetical protein
MKNVFLGFILVAAGCAHVEGPTKVVQFPYAHDLVDKVQKSIARVPASIDHDEKMGKSPRRIYFSVLYHQYQTIGQILDKNADVNLCPQFHHDKIEMDSKMIPKMMMYSSVHVDEDGKKFFPELAFSGSFSLQDYHGLIRTEIEALCEEGISDNFYKFDNLITHYAHKNSFHKDPKAMESVLKIPVFANFYLVKMLEIPHLKIVTTEEKMFIGLTRTHWFENYVAEASKLRSLYIKNKMVGR